MLNLKSFEEFNESVWSDMQDRGTGDAIKNEDNIDFMDKDDFWSYLTVKYKVSGSGCGVFKRMSSDDWRNKDTLVVIIEKWKNELYRYSYELEFDWDNENNKSNLRIYYHIDPLSTKNGWHYNVWQETQKDYKEDAFFKEYVDASKIFGDEYVIDKNKISPKNGNLENHHVIDILDKCLSIVKKPYVKKIKKPKYHKEWVG